MKDNPLKMSEITLPCPAKLNLFLHINERRDDGYHELQTLFQLLDYGDELSIKLSTDTCDITVSPELPSTPTCDNLIYKVARALKEQTNTTHGASFKVNKRLPMGGGLGGGSSNAASALIGLNSLWQTRLSLEKLCDIGRTFGADIPVFIQGHSAWAEGIGDILTPIVLSDRFYVVLTPDCHVSTQDIFLHKNLTRNTPKIKVAAFLEKGGVNDFQPLVEILYPKVKKSLTWLNQFAEATLTGTGASVFAAFDTQQNAQHVLDKLFSATQEDSDMQGCSGFVAKGINQSPLHSHFIGV